MPKMPFWLLAKAYSAPGSGAMAVNFSRFRGLRMLQNQEKKIKYINTVNSDNFAMLAKTVT